MKFIYRVAHAAKKQYVRKSEQPFHFRLKTYLHQIRYIYIYIYIYHFVHSLTLSLLNSRYHLNRNAHFMPSNNQLVIRKKLVSA